MNKQNKVILITGSSTGFGYLAAQQFAEKGYIVYATMRKLTGNNHDAAQALRQYHTNIHVLDLDVTEDASVQQAVNRVIDEQGKIDVLINNAGIMNLGFTEAFTMEQLQTQMNVNYFGVARMFKAVLPHMRKRKEGLVITVSSVAGRLPFPAFGSYCSSKYAVEALAEGYRYELSPFGVDSVIIEPGPFGTNLLANSPSPRDKLVLNDYSELTQLHEAVITNFENFIQENIDDGICNPQIVVNDMLTLIETSFGKRALRTVSGVDYGVRDLNQAYEQYELAILNNMELSHLNPNHHREEEKQQ